MQLYKCMNDVPVQMGLHLCVTICVQMFVYRVMFEHGIVCTIECVFYVCKQLFVHECICVSTCMYASVCV